MLILIPAGVAWGLGYVLLGRPLSGAIPLELNATTNVNFDLQRYGIDWVASPLHADGLVFTGPSPATCR